VPLRRIVVKVLPLSPVLRGEGRGEGLFCSYEGKAKPLTLTLSPEYERERG
jgi:hypothetical protein